MQMYITFSTTDSSMETVIYTGIINDVESLTPTLDIYKLDSNN
jgi:hypothetical protein